MKKEFKTFYKNRLPHIAPRGAEFFVTFRLADSIPTPVILSLNEEMELSIKRVKRENPKDLKFKINRIKNEFSVKYDKYLHNLHGECYLRKEEIATIVANRIQKYDAKFYTLEAYTIMPNHVHLLIDTSIQLENNNNDAAYVQLDKIMKLIKGGSAFEANKILGRKGTFWMKDSYDHYIRNEKEWDNILEYIINNPVDAGLVNNWNDWKFTYCKYF